MNKLKSELNLKKRLKERWVVNIPFTIDECGWLFTSWIVNSLQERIYQPETENKRDTSSGGEPRQEGSVGTKKYYINF